jgi:hypothetical protein
MVGSAEFLQFPFRHASSSCILDQYENPRFALALQHATIVTAMRVRLDWLAFNLEVLMELM